MEYEVIYLFHVLNSSHKILVLVHCFNVILATSS